MCLIGEGVAYLYALLIRYVILNWYYTNPTRENDFYKVFFWVVLLCYWAVFQFRKNQNFYQPDEGQLLPYHRGGLETGVC